MGRRGAGAGWAGTALVGDPETVAKRMLEYADLGIETFILSGIRIGGSLTGWRVTLSTSALEQTERVRV